MIIRKLIKLRKFLIIDYSQAHQAEASFWLLIIRKLIKLKQVSGY